MPEMVCHHQAAAGAHGLLSTQSCSFVYKTNEQGLRWISCKAWPGFNQCLDYLAGDGHQASSSQHHHFQQCLKGYTGFSTVACGSESFSENVSRQDRSTFWELWRMLHFVISEQGCWRGAGWVALNYVGMRQWVPAVHVLRTHNLISSNGALLACEQGLTCKRLN